MDKLEEPVDEPAAAQLRNVTIASLLSMLLGVEQCHGCLGEDANWSQYREQLDAAGDLIGMPIGDRWWT